MPISSSLVADLKSAMLAHEAEKVSVLRLLQSELKYAMIKKGAELDENEVIQVIRREVKKREDAATLYTQQGQPDRATQEKSEITILSNYLPASVDTKVVEEFIRERLKTLGEPTPALRGQLIKETLAHFGNQVDGRMVSTLVATILG